MYVYIYIYIYTSLSLSIHIYIYIYTYIDIHRSWVKTSMARRQTCDRLRSLFAPGRAFCLARSRHGASHDTGRFTRHILLLLSFAQS